MFCAASFSDGSCVRSGCTDCWDLRNSRRSDFKVVGEKMNGPEGGGPEGRVCGKRV